MNVIVPYTPSPTQDPAVPARWNWSCETELGRPGFPYTISGNSRLGEVAKPSDGVFSICDFDENPTSFFETLAAAKIEEIRDSAGAGGTPVVPLKPAAALLGVGFCLLWPLRRRGA